MKKQYQIEENVLLMFVALICAILVIAVGK